MKKLGIKKLMIYAGLGIGGFAVTDCSAKVNDSAYYAEAEQLNKEELAKTQFTPLIKSFNPNESDMDVADKSANLLIDNGFRVSSDYFDSICSGIEINKEYLDADGYLLGSISDLEFVEDSSTTEVSTQPDFLKKIENPIVKADNNCVTADVIAIDTANLLLENGYSVNNAYFDNVCPGIIIYDEYFNNEGYLISNVSDIEMEKSFSENMLQK